jgi:soluble lytic murein transglycosylase-like protein
MVSVLLIPLVNMEGQASAPAAPTEPANVAQGAKDNAKSRTEKTVAPPVPVPGTKKSGLAGSNQAAMEAMARKQREATLAAMQASVDKQRASVSAGVAASIGKQALSAAKPPTPLAGSSFFNLPRLDPPPENSAASFTMPEATIADVACDPVPESEVAPILLEAAQREGLEPGLLTAVIQQESAFRPCAISKKGAQGLMQLIPSTAEQFGVKEPFDSKQNVDAGAKYLKELLTRYTGNLSLALAAYNAGPDKVDEAHGVPPIPETTAYVNEILGKLHIQPVAAIPAASSALAAPEMPGPPTPPNQ